MTFKVRIDRAIEDLREPWRELTGEASFYLSYEWLKSVEASFGARSFYVTVRENADGRPLLGLPCYLIEGEGPYTYYNPPRLLAHQDFILEGASFLSVPETRRLEELSKALHDRRSELYPSLVCAAPYGYTIGLVGRGRLAPEEAREAAAHLLDAVEELARSLAAKNLAFLYLPEGDEPELEEELTARGFARHRLAGACFLPVEWPDFEGYVRSTKDKRQRSVIRRERRRFQERLTFRLADASELDANLARLQANVHRKHGHGGDPERIARGFRSIKIHLRPFVRLFLASRNERPVGFMLAYEKKDVLYCKQVGFDYEALGNDFCYYNLTYYEPVAWAAGRGFRRLHYGLGAYRAKLLRGCRLSGLFGYFRFCAKNDEAAVLAAETLALQSEAKEAYFTRLAPSVTER